METSIFSSRIARRIFTTFVICALLPVTALAVTTYLQVTRHLRQQTFESLHHGVKFQTQALNDRILTLEKDLKLVVSWVQTRRADNAPLMGKWLRTELEKGFGSVTLVSSAGKSRPLLNSSVVNAWPLAFDEVEHLAAGRVLLAELVTPAATPALFMLSLVDPRTLEKGLVVAEIKPAYLWAAREMENLPQDARFCVLDATGRLLYASRPEDAPQFAGVWQSNTRTSTGGHFEFGDRKETCIASFSQVFLKPQYKLSHWTLMVYKAKSDVFAPLAEFKQKFPLIILLALIPVLWLSIAHIRRNLMPIDALKEGARRITRRDFSRKVDINSGDEFQELSVSFNDMAAQLHRQLNELGLIADLGGKITADASVRTLGSKVLDSIRQYLDFDAVALHLAEAVCGSDPFLETYGFNRHECAALQQLNLIFGPDDPFPVIWSHERSEVEPSLPAGMPGVLQKLRYRALIWVPIADERLLLGGMLFVRRKGGAARIESDRKILGSLAAQVAIRLTGIQAFERVRESEERFRKAFEHSAAGMLMAGPDGTFLKVNPVFCRMLGYSEVELLGKKYPEIVHPRDLARCRMSFERIVRGDIDAASLEVRGLHRNGHPVWALISTSLLRKLSGEPQHFITLVQDLSVQKQVQQEKQKLEAQLMQAQKIESLGTLAGGIAHDFNNILSGISGYTQLSLLALAGNDAVCANLSEVMNAVGRATQLVRQILTFSRQSNSEKNPLQMSVVIKEALKLLRATIPANIEIVQHVSNDPGLALADPTQIHQVVMNLCTNAFHAIQQKGSGTIRVDFAHVNAIPRQIAARRRAKRADHPDAGYLRLRVSDTGCGMTPEVVERIFEPYFSTKEQGKGTGLGLSVVHGIIEGHDGLIDVQSVPGEQTTFEIFFPELKGDHAARTAPRTDLPTGRERILFVDDEVDLTRISQALLKRLGYSVTCHNDPPSALAAVRADPKGYDLVITDMAMPNLTGDRLAAEILKVRPEIPIILSSGYSEIDRYRQYGGELFSDYMAKPVTIDCLAATVRRTIDRHQAERQRSTA